MADFQQGRQVDVDRLKRRLNNYRSHNSVSNHHFESTVDSIYGDQHKQTLLLKQRHIESKVKKSTKKSDNKKLDTSTSLLSAMGQSKLLARSHDQGSSSGDVQDTEPAAKKQRLANGAMVTAAAPDASEFQIAQQLQNLKSNTSPNPNTVTNTVTVPNTLPTSSVSVLAACAETLESLGDNGLSGTDADEAIKKENDLDIPNDALLEDFGELSNFEDIDMGINLEDFVHDLDLDNIKHENSNSGMDTFFKEEGVDNIFDDPPNIADIGSVVNASRSVPLGNQGINKIATSVAPSSFSQYSNTSQSVTHSTTASSFPQSFSSSLAQQFNNSSPASAQYTMTSGLPKMRVNATNMTMGQSDIVLAAQTLKQMAEQHQTKLSPPGNAVRTNICDFTYNNMGNNVMMNQPTSAANQMYNSGSINQVNPIYNQSLTSEMELKRRQQMMQQYSSIQPVTHQQSSSGQQCNQPVGQSSSPGVQQGSTPLQHKQMQQQPQAQQSQNSQQPTSQLQQANQQQQQQQQQQQHQQQQQQQHQQQQHQQHQQPQPQSQSQGPSQPPQSQIQQQQQQSPSSQLQQQQPQQAQQVNQQVNQQSQMRNSLSPFSSRMSPLTSYAHSPQGPNQMGMSPQFVNTICPGMSSNTVRGSYSTATRGGSPIPASPQGQPANMAVPTGSQPRFIQQQMIGSVGMMRPQMMAQTGQMMARPPPPEYRQAAMMHQHQAMIGEPMSQTMPQMHQGMGQMPPFQGMRPGFRPTMGGAPAGPMAGGQMMAGMNQQSIPANLPTMKGSVMQGGSMGIPATMGQGSVGPPGAMGANCLSVTMNQVAGGGSMGIVNTRPTMMQRTRNPNMNMGIPGMGMSTQMPPSRPEWRQMMMQQNQAGIMMGPGIRHGYQQTQGGGMIGQASPMLVQRPQSHMIGMVGMQGNPAIQHAVSMSSGGNPIQGTASISVSHNNPGMPTFPPGARLSQHNQSSMGPGQGHPVMQQISQQGLRDSRVTVNMGSQGHGGSPSNLAQMGVATPTTLSHHITASGGPANMNTMGGSAPSAITHMNSTNMSPLSQGGGANSANVNAVNQTPTANLNSHPRSPAAMNQMHPCSPAASGAASSQQRPMSNPSLGLNPSSQPSSGSGSCSPLLACSTAPQGRPVAGLSSGRGTMQSNVPQAMSGMPQSVAGLQQGHPMSQGGNAGSVMISQGGNGAVAGLGVTIGSQRPPESQGGNAPKTSESLTAANPPPHLPASSGSSDFDLMFNEGEFAALLS